MSKFSQLFGAQDMTVGSPAKSIIKFSVPLLIGNLAQLLYSTVDSIIVGKYVGDVALAAIGVSMPILNLLLLLFMGVSMGAGVMVSQYFGAKQRDKLTGTVGTTLTVTLIVSIITTAIGTLLTGPLLKLLGTPEDVYPHAWIYLVILFVGITGSAYYNIISGILRGLGDAIMPLIFLLLACGLNIVLDLLFVIAFDMGVAGVAWATIIAQLISAIFCLIKLISMRDVVDITWKSLKPDGKLTRQLIKLGLPSGLTQGIFSLSMLVVQGLTNTFGTLFIAVSTVVMRVDSFAMMPNFTFGTAMTTYSGQNIGANKLDRVKEGTKKGLQIGITISVTLVLCLLIFGEGLMRLFTNTPEVIEQGARILRILAVGYISVCVNQILCGVMRGAGATMVPMWISIITTIFARIPIAYGLVYLTKTPANPLGNSDMVYVSLLISWVLGGILSIVFYARGKWKNKSVVMRNASNPDDLEISEYVDPDELENIEQVTVAEMGVGASESAEAPETEI